MPSSLAAAAAGINSLSINKKEDPKKPTEPKKSSLLAAASSSSSSSAPSSSSSKSNHSKHTTTKKTAVQDTRNKDSNTHRNKKKQQQKSHTKSSLIPQTKPKEKVVAQFEFSLDSSNSDHEESFKNTSKPKHTDQRERKIDVAVSKRLIGHALNQKSTHCNGHLYGNSLDETQGNRKNHGNHRRNNSNQDDGSHTTLRYSNRNKDRKSHHENRNSRKNKHNDGPPSRNDRWNHDFSSSTKPPTNRQSNKKSSGNCTQNESVPKPNTKATKPEFHIISSSEAIGVAAASNWAEDSDSDEGW